jgi:hypothetical protein
MSREPRKIIKQWIMILTGVSVLLLIYYPFSPAAIQKREMAHAEQFLGPLRDTIKADSRFKEFSSGVSTNVCIFMECEVSSESDFDVLLKMIEASRSKVRDVCPIIVRAEVNGSTTNGEYRVLRKTFEAKKER